MDSVTFFCDFTFHSNTWRLVTNASSKPQPQPPQLHSRVATGQRSLRRPPLAAGCGRLGCAVCAPPRRLSLQPRARERCGRRLACAARHRADTPPELRDHGARAEHCSACAVRCAPRRRVAAARRPLPRAVRRQLTVRCAATCLSRLGPGVAARPADMLYSDGPHLEAGWRLEGT